MATLTIGNRRVTVDDRILSMPPEEQQKAIDEIATQIPAEPAAATAPVATPAAPPDPTQPATDLATPPPPLEDFPYETPGIPSGQVPPVVQGAGRGAAEAAAFIPDTMIAAPANAVLSSADAISRRFGGPEIPLRVPKTSDLIAAPAEAVAERAGFRTSDYDRMPFSDKLLYNVGRFGAQAGASIPFLTRAAGARAAELVGGGTPQKMDWLLRPYMGENVKRTVAGDAAATVGSATGVTVADEYGPKDNPLVSIASALGGGVGGVGVLGLAEAMLRGGMKMMGRPFGAHLDKDIPYDPKVPLTEQRPVTTAVSDKAAREVQSRAVDPEAALTRMNENRAALEPHIETLPTPGQLSEDPGLLILDRQVGMRNQKDSLANQQQFQTAVRDTVDQVAPAGANPEDLIARAGVEATMRQSAADAKVASKEKALDKVAEIRGRQGDEVADYRDGGVRASQDLHREIVDQSLQPMAKAKRDKYNKVTDTPVMPTELVEKAENVRQLADQLPPNARARIFPSGFMDDIEKWVVRDTDEKSPTFGQVLEIKPTTFQVLNRIRPQISKEIENARKANAPPELLDNLEAIRQGINDVTEKLPAAAAANKHFNEVFAPVWGREQPAAYQFRKDYNKDPQRQTAVPAEDTAGRFIQPEQPSRTASLQNILGSMKNPSEAQRAARDYLMADLAQSGALSPDGLLRPNAIRNWAGRNRDNLELVPGMRNDIDAILARAEKGERVTGSIQTELKTAQKNAKLTERDIDRGALGAVLNSDPDKAVARIMSDPYTSGGKLDELVRLTAGDERARNGLKAAVRDYMVDKATSTAAEKLVPGDKRGPVSHGKLSKIFKEHEQQLAQIFSPEEMNTLRAGHRALELANASRLRVATGADTAEKTVNIIDAYRDTGIGRGLEAAARIKFGALATGGKIAGLRKAFGGIGVQEQEDVARLVERAAFDPDLMALLLGRKVPVGSPAWNRKFNQVLAVGEGARDFTGEQPTAP